MSDDTPSLSSADADALAAISGEWVPGPLLPDRVLARLSSLLDWGLIEREFMDDKPPSAATGEDDEGPVLRIGVSACWHYRLTPKGASIKRTLPKFGGR